MKFGHHSRQLESNVLHIYHVMIIQQFMTISGMKQKTVAWEHATKDLKSQFLISFTTTPTLLRMYSLKTKSTLLKQLSEKDLSNS